MVSSRFFFSTAQERAKNKPPIRAACVYHKRVIARGKDPWQSHILLPKVATDAVAALRQDGGLPRQFVNGLAMT